ncbi:hypothetical protein evm_008517 [Chilo suppressalis]|nr:hypothetical protein evm_008517 [Chilo suppressalis]
MPRRKGHANFTRENIVHHDCMWAGSCADSVHPGNMFVPTDFVPATPGQSLLRRDNMSPPRPETPPSLDRDGSGITPTHWLVSNSTTSACKHLRTLVNQGRRANAVAYAGVAIVLFISNLHVQNRLLRKFDSSSSAY